MQSSKVFSCGNYKSNDAIKRVKSFANQDSFGSDTIKLFLTFELVLIFHFQFQNVNAAYTKKFRKEINYRRFQKTSNSSNKCPN